MQDKSILLIDDERHMLKLLEFNLRKTGASLLQATSAEQALRTLESSPVDLVVTDYMLEGQSGLDLVRAMRVSAVLHGIPVILLTARGQMEIREEAEGLGIHAFLNKPFSPAELVAQARAALGLAG